MLAVADLVLACWIAVGGAGVETAEAYTLPAAVGLLVVRLAPAAAAAARPGRPRAPRSAWRWCPRRWRSSAAPTALRLVLVVAGAVAMVVVGTLAHRQAPFVLGAGALAFVVATRLGPYAPLLPTWVSLADRRAPAAGAGRDVRAPAAPGPRGGGLGGADGLSGTCRPPVAWSDDVGEEVIAVPRSSRGASTRLRSASIRPPPPAPPEDDGLRRISPQQVLLAAGAVAVVVAGAASLSRTGWVLTTVLALGAAVGVGALRCAARPADARRRRSPSPPWCSSCSGTGPTTGAESALVLAVLAGALLADRAARP